MGSSYFYLEFLVSWASKLKDSGYNNPCVFALDYTLVPDLRFPVQLNEAYRGYQVLHELAGPGAELVVAGDSAGGNLALSLLLHLARPRNSEKLDKTLRKPSFATIISPWTVLVSFKNKDTEDDFLSAKQLHQYGVLYANSQIINDPYKSPGICKDLKWWDEAVPGNGMHIVYGSQEVFAGEIRSLILQIGKLGDERLRVTEKSAVHVWPVVQSFLGVDVRQREEGLELITAAIAEALGARKSQLLN
ncbi:hypothetical protein ABW19_dt0205086 [Dactylella cylindrospora]|nr:hypothetical protein ABW19_dt0205086 [Dactylella cylindrospora]